MTWHPWAGLALAAGATAITRAVWIDIFRTALGDIEESGHVMLAPLVFLWLAWIRRKQLAECRPIGQWLGPVLIAIGWLVCSRGYRHNQHTFSDSGAILIAMGALVSFTGYDVLRRFLPAFGVLVFLIPIWPERRQQLSGPLQIATARVTQGLCEMLGMMVERQNSNLAINGVDVSVAEACNGMRMVFTLLLVCYAYVFITPLRWGTRAAILIASPLIAIACNVLRLVPTVWMFGHASRLAAERFHEWSGWVMLAVEFLLLAFLMRAMRWAAAPVKKPEGAAS